MYVYNILFKKMFMSVSVKLAYPLHLKVFEPHT